MSWGIVAGSLVAWTIGVVGAARSNGGWREAAYLLGGSAALVAFLAGCWWIGAGR